MLHESAEGLGRGEDAPGRGREGSFCWRRSARGEQIPGRGRMQPVPNIFNMSDLWADVIGAFHLGIKDDLAFSKRKTLVKCSEASRMVPFHRLLQSAALISVWDEATFLPAWVCVCVCVRAQGWHQSNDPPCMTMYTACCRFNHQ